MSKLWAKGYGIDELLEKYTVGNDYILDRSLIVSDCIGSMAHGKMLHSIELLSDDDWAKIKAGLIEITGIAEKGEFEIPRALEDGHTAIENYLTEKYGEAGKKIHLGRSRNDQVVTSTRIYQRSFVLGLTEQLFGLIEVLLQNAETYKDVPMVGRTHMQIAMPSSVGLWLASFAESLLDDFAILWAVYNVIDSSPLGSAASYGVPLPLNREMVAELLGFSRVQNNVMSVQNSRGKTEVHLVNAMEGIMLTLSKLAEDLMIFTMPEFGYFSLPKELCTGSSIMPQKQNPDGLELLRGKAASMSGYAAGLRNIIRALPSGYNRDFQETKDLFMKAFDVTFQSIQIMQLSVEKLSVNGDALRKAFTPDTFATDVAIEYVQQGMTFRDAYVKVGTNLDALENRNPDDTIGNRTSTGTAGNLNLEYAFGKLKEYRASHAAASAKVEKAIQQLAGKELKVL